MRALRLSTTKRIRSTLPGREHLGGRASHGGELQSFRRCSVTLNFLRSLRGSKARRARFGHTPLLIFGVDTLWLAGFACKRLSHLSQQGWQGLSSKHTTGLFGS
jgi:hypothetical protein